MSGKRLWRYPVPVQVWLYSNDRIFITSMQGDYRQGDKSKEHWRVIALDSHTGHTLWEQNAPDVFDDLMLLDCKSNLYLSVGVDAERSKLFALNPTTGKYAWTRTFARMSEKGAQTCFFSSVVNGDAISVYTADGHLYKVDGKNGKNTDSSVLSNGFQEPSYQITFADQLYSVVYKDGFLTAASSSTKKSLFSLKTDQPASKFIINNQLLLFCTVSSDVSGSRRTCRLVAIDLRTKTVKWTFKTPTLLNSALILNDRVCFGLDFPDSTFYAVSLSTGKEIWRSHADPCRKMQTSQHS